MGLHQTNDFLQSNGNHHQSKKTTTEWENVFTNISDKELMSKIYKELTKLNTKKTTQLKNGQRAQIHTSPKKTYR